MNAFSQVGYQAQDQLWSQASYQVWSPVERRVEHWVCSQVWFHIWTQVNDGVRSVVDEHI